MADVGVFPSLPGLAWSVTKVPTFQTRIQRAVSGRELRALDYPYPLWQYTLDFNFLRDNPSASFNELRNLMGFFLLCQGAFGTFLYHDPSDNRVVGQILPQPLSVGQSATPYVNGANYLVGDIVSAVGGTLTPAIGRALKAQVTSVTGAGAVTGLSIVDGGAYSVVPGVTGIVTAGGAGSGATINVAWATTVQLVRTLGDFSQIAGGVPIPNPISPPFGFMGGGFTEPVTAPAAIQNIYFNGAPQNLSASGWATDYTTGLVTLPGPFFNNRVYYGNLAAVGLNYSVGDILSAVGGVGPATAMWQVTAVLAEGTVSGIMLLATGEYSTIPGTYGVPLSGGTGTGAKVDIAWTTTPVITADFTYYFRCRFVDDSYSFENFMLRLWQLKKLNFITVRA